MDKQRNKVKMLSTRCSPKQSEMKRIHCNYLRKQKVELQIQPNFNLFLSKYELSEVFSFWYVVKGHSTRE